MRLSADKGRLNDLLPISFFEAFNMGDLKLFFICTGQMNSAQTK
jgi:hypothetical protein